MEIQDIVDVEASLVDTIIVLMTMVGLGWYVIWCARLRAKLHVRGNHILFIVGVASSTIQPYFLCRTDLW